MYKVRVEKDSVSCEGSRCTSFVIEAPRIVLAELVTHRNNYDTWGEISWCERTTDRPISKNSASSRAIPFPRFLEKIRQDPYLPTWTLNQPGMQGNYASDPDLIMKANEIWLRSRDNAIQAAEELHALGIHKQDCNRLLEPWAWVTQIVTSTRWDNFFALRCHKAAHPAFRKIARLMFLARKQSLPKQLEFTQWHLPFIPDDMSKDFRHTPYKGNPLPDLIKFSAARCAWISYENHDRDGSPEQMLKTFDRLFAEIPVHASPIEHQCTPMPGYDETNFKPHLYERLQGNLHGWIQARKLVNHEEITEYNPDDKELAAWKEQDIEVE